MQTPRYLEKGDTVGIVAPARKVNREEIDRFVALLQSWGLNYQFGRNLFKKFHQYSGTDRERAADFQEMIDNPEIRAIFPVRGGYGSIRVLQHLDFTKFAKHPKWITGFSDITVFHSYLSKYLNTESF